jgi:hypothetical protein
MQFTRLIFAGLAVAAIAACSDDPVSTEVSPGASAAIRWVNAVPDTVAMDYRIVDYPSNASEPNLAFRASSGNWRILPAGTHRIRVFFTNTTAAGSMPAVVSQIFLDTTLTFEVGKKYTLLHYGYAKTGATPKQRLIVIEDDPPTPAAGQVAIRAINAAPGIGPVDLYSQVVLDTTTAAASVSGAPLFANIPLAGVTAWTSVAAAPSGRTFRVDATAPGSATVIADLLAPAGLPAVAQTPTTAPTDPIAGARQGQSAITFVVFGPRVAYVLKTPAGASVNVAGSATGGATTLLDRHPPRISQ